jgi:hypothetical protein
MGHDDLLSEDLFASELNDDFLDDVLPEADPVDEEDEEAKELGLDDEEDDVADIGGYDPEEWN